MFPSFSRQAIRSGKSINEYLLKFKNSIDPDLHFQAEMMQNMLTRYQEHSQAMLALTEASPFSRPFVFLKYVNLEIFKGTLAHFQPGLMFNWEGLIYAVVGMGLGFFCFYLLKTAFSFFSFILKKMITEKNQFS